MKTIEIDGIKLQLEKEGVKINGYYRSVYTKLLPCNKCGD